MRPDRLAILGLGGIGASVGLRARAAGVARVVGWSPSRSEGMAALTRGAVDDVADRVDRAVAGADLVLAALPFAELRPVLDRARGHLAAPAIVAVVAELHAPVLALARDLALAGRLTALHPLAAAERVAADGAELWPGLLTYVADASAEGGDEATRAVMGFVEEVLGGAPVRVDPARHDAQVAWTRGLIPAASAALVHLLASRELGGVTWDRRAGELLRALPADPAAASEALAANGPAIAAALEHLGAELERLAALLRAGDRAGIERYLNEAAAFRPSVR